MMAGLPDTRLLRDFYARPSTTVARELLGQRLVRILEHGQRLSGLICETEAYGGPDDEASHAYRFTRRSAIMYGPPGHAYVYLIYGMHYCLNAVTEPDGIPGAVLIRAILPQENVETMRTLRTGAADARLCDGPGKLCQALSITTLLNGRDLVTGEQLFIEKAAPVAAQDIVITPRIGVRGNPEVRNRPWRFIWKR